MKVYETLDLRAKDLVVGKHGVWWPGEGIKVPFQWGGRIQKYRYPHEASYELDLIREEWGLLDFLSMFKMAPPVGEWVYFKVVISEHPGAYWADPCGAYGYRMADANGLPAGVLTSDAPVSEQVLRAAAGRLQGSPGAVNDLNKPGNVVNGYLVDARRSGWDRLRWAGPLPDLVRYGESKGDLRDALQEDGQFPFRERKEAYQDYYLYGAWHRGERQVVERAALLDFPPAWRGPEDTVLDLGCHVGGFLHHAWLAGLTRLVGVDANPSYVDLAQRLARANGWNICYRAMSVEDPALIDWLRQLWPGGVTYLLLLSMLKHLPSEAALWALVDNVAPEHLYLETNAVKEGHEAPLGVEVRRRRGTLVGWSTDRNHRACYRVPRVSVAVPLHPGDGGTGTAAFLGT